MRILVRALVPLALLACAAAPAFAGSEERKGTNGALELQIPIGPRGSALGGSVVSDVSGVEGLFWNPAGLATLKGTEALFSHTNYFADQKLNYAGVGVNMGNFGVLGFQAKVLSIGDVIVTTEDAPEGTGEILDPTFIVLGVSYARQFTDRVGFGTTVNYVNESIASTSASGVAFDFGVQYATGWRGLRIGMAMKNFGPSMEFRGGGFEFSSPRPGDDPSASPRIVTSTSSKFEMPSYFTLGATYDLMRNSTYGLALLGAFQNNNFQGDNVRAGLEWGYRDMLAVRASWFGTFGAEITGDQTTNDEPGSEFDSGDDLYSGLALGAGFAIRTGDTGRLGVDLAWMPVRDNLFDDILELGVKFRF